MNDQELFGVFEEYIKDQGWTYEKAAGIIGFEKSTLFNWKNGKPISPRGRDAIRLLTKKALDPFCYLEKCPAEKPVDHFLMEILEDWKYLDPEQRAQVAGLASKLSASRKDREASRTGQGCENAMGSGALSKKHS